MTIDKEFGGYMSWEVASGNEYHSNLIPLNSGRNALLYILLAKKIRKLYIPYYLCESIPQVCAKNGLSYAYYHIEDNFLPLFDKDLDKDEYIFIVNYYGSLSQKTQIELKRKYKNIIVDNTQAFFLPPVIGIDTIYSCRKFFGVPDGAYLSSSTLLQYGLVQDSSKGRLKHLLGRFEENAQDYYTCFLENEAIIDNLTLRSMSKITHNILRSIDYSQVIHTRLSNFSVLLTYLGKINNLKNLPIHSAPFAYPLYIKNGNKIRKRLAEKKIYVPTLWVNVLENGANNLEKDYVENILPLPCDQRYSAFDMQTIAYETLELFKQYN